MAETTRSNDDLHMVQIWLDVRRLVELGRALHLPVQRTDHNYIAHCALGELFGDQAPRPFCVEGDDGRRLRVLGYTSASAEQLKTTAQSQASPMVYEICDWPRLAAKPMPAQFPPGLELAFELRACPVVRKSSAGKHHQAGVEVDAFLARVWEVDDSAVPVDREAVYAEWLKAQFERQGAATAQSVRLERFALERMLRRTHGGDRTAKTVKRPAATLVGALEVADGERFAELLRRGIGRHRSFGFGMLKVRPLGG